MGFDKIFKGTQEELDSFLKWNKGRIKVISRGAKSDSVDADGFPIVEYIFEYRFIYG